MLATAGLALTSCERSFEGDLATAGNEANTMVIIDKEQTTLNATDGKPTRQ